MHLFVNSLEGRVAAAFFYLLDKVFITWNELVYGFKSMFGNAKNHVFHKPTLESLNIVFLWEALNQYIEITLIYLLMMLVGLLISLSSYIFLMKINISFLKANSSLKLTYRLLMMST